MPHLVRLFFAGLVMLAISAFVPVSAQEAASPPTPPDGSSQDEDRPVVGLVLSGGGAKGLAHVGVLRVLEEIHVPVDLVVGTSAGAAVGALYAQGMTVAEIEERLLEMDWVSSFRDNPGRRYEPVRRKEDNWRFPIRPGLGVGLDGLRVGRGLISGQNLGFILNELTEDAALVRDFDQLPIPFRAVATDLETGEEVVLSDGSLAEAIRASMSIPGVYAPVSRDGRLLVDGGVANNLPVSVAREMGAEVVIVVDISDKPGEGRSLDQAFSVVGQLTTLMTLRSVEEQLASLTPDDVLITPDLTGLGSADFFQVPLLMELGATAARNQSSALNRLSVGEERWRNELALRTERSFQPGVISQVVIRQDSRLSDRFLRDRIRQKTGKPLDQQQLEEDLKRIYGLGYYETVSYSLSPGDEGTVLEILVREKSWGPNYLSFGLGYEENFESDTRFNVAASLRMTQLNRLGGEWQTGLQLGTQPWVRTEWFQPLDYGYRRFLVVGAEYEKDRYSVFGQEGDREAEVDVSSRQVDLALGTELGANAEMRLTVERGYARVDDRVGDSQATGDRIDQGSWNLRYVYDSLDDPFLPESGTFAGLRGRFERPGLGADSDFDQAVLRLASAGSRGDWVVSGEFFASVVTRGEAGIENNVLLGGFRRLSAYGQGEITGQDAVIGSVVAYHKFGGPIVPFFLGAGVEAGNAWEDIGDAERDDLLTSGTILAGMDTVIGPVQAALAYNNDDRWGIYLNVGYSLQQLFD
ncbi:patatin-like phospholipase family protein [Marinobacter sp. OP 3.4]|uniref:patatin-like phospholipase family protein n=1 Tax=Marinobacter sp. OP 3.4 TaxID=3076501 RepID=UPI002E1B7E0B